MIFFAKSELSVKFGSFYNGIKGAVKKNIANKKIFETEHVDLQHLYIDGSKFEATANKYSWVWKKATEKSRYRSDMDCFIPLMKKFHETYGFYPKYPVADVLMQRNTKRSKETVQYGSIRS